MKEIFISQSKRISKIYPIIEIFLSRQKTTLPKRNENDLVGKGTFDYYNLKLKQGKRISCHLFIGTISN